MNAKKIRIATHPDVIPYASLCCTFALPALIIENTMNRKHIAIKIPIFTSF